MVKLADTPDLGSGALGREGSSPSPSSERKKPNLCSAFFVPAYRRYNLRSNLAILYNNSPQFQQA